jgi:threonine synthase
MDVGAPSNVERLQHLFPRLSDLDADAVSDDEIRAIVARTWQACGRAICPHTACGVEVLRRLRERGATGTWIVAATAHPAKFAEVVEPIIGETVAPPPALAALLARPAHAEPLDPTLDALRAALEV